LNDDDIFIIIDEHIYFDLRGGVPVPQRIGDGFLNHPENDILFDVLDINIIPFLTAPYG
jgi:hypothetical protein